jgi:hypothetical protein
VVAVATVVVVDDVAEVVLELVVDAVEVVVCEVMLDVVEVTDVDAEVVVVVAVDEEDTDDDDDGLIASAITPESVPPVFVPNDRVPPDIELERESYWA